MTILCRCENIETSEGVPLYVTGVAQVITHRLPHGAANPSASGSSSSSSSSRMTQNEWFSNGRGQISELSTPSPSPALAPGHAPRSVGNADRCTRGRSQIQLLPTVLQRFALAVTLPSVALSTSCAWWRAERHLLVHGRALHSLWGRWEARICATSQGNPCTRGETAAVAGSLGLDVGFH